MKVSRRKFLRMAGVTAIGSLAAKLGYAPKAAEAGGLVDAEDLRISYAQTVTQICTFCGVGCGLLCFVEDGKIVAVEGDPDHPINEGSLCSKGSGIFNMYYVYNEKGEAVQNPQRLTQVLYRAPKASEWEVKDWDWALETMARRIKDTRDQYFEEKNNEGVTVNRCTALAWLGSAMCNNEENYLYHKFCRSHGIINIDHCARL